MSGKNNQKKKTQGAQKAMPPPFPTRMEITGMPKLEARIDSEPQSEEHFQKTYGPKKPWTRFEKWSAWIAGVGLCATIVALLVYGFQLNEMRKATVATERAAKAAEDAIGEAQKSAHIDQRAWLGVKADFSEPKVGQPVVAKITIGNVGKTPAIKSRFYGCIAVGQIRFDKYEDVKKAGQTTAPGSANSNVTIFPSADFTVYLATPDTITKETDINGIRTGLNIIHMGGSITYGDVFGNSHYTHFFVIYNPKTKGLEAQEDYNDAN